MKKVKKVILYGVLTLALVISAAILFVRFGQPKVSEASDLKVEGTPQQIQRGEYLAMNVLNCIDCHSQRDFSVFAGPIVPGTEGQGGEVFDESLGLPGTLYSKNITPHNLGNWTDGEIYRLITTGVKKDGEPIFPFMPYPGFSHLDQEDVKSVIAYLRTLKPIANEVKESEVNFPVNLIMRTLPKDCTPGKKPSPSNQVEYGKYLVTVAACGDCHTPQENGQFNIAMAFAGGNEFPLQGFGIVRSMNITPDKETGIGTWTEEMFLNKFKNPEMPHNKGVKVNKGEFQTIMPWTNYARMTDEDINAIYAYLKTVKPITNKVERFTSVSN
ncbi:MAG TPA: c-type cytochrome [Cytophagales bacterium]|nr:c-type cytochrome [Cytophagales bacterium]